ncbi:MAG: M48 family metallopeptidase, partial [Lentimicrobiaceae bacterium]|nr:M48 family metallopeptidase [Lentimicrobiaceae bacterium]
MQKFFAILSFFILTICLQAQNNYDDAFDRLEPIGEMPGSFQKILLKKTNSFNICTNDVNELDEMFVFTLLMNGRVLYGDPVTQYLNLLLNKILEQKPDMRKIVQIYALKSEQVNAFATPAGNIFVNLGLIARCANEAELAFIICHELAHFAQAQSEDNLKKDADKIKDIDDFLKYHSRSRELELLADKSGFLDFFKNLDYDYQVFEDVFDML